MENNDWVIFDGNIISAGEPVVPAVSRGLMYGDGVFETFRTYDGQTLFLQEHLDRLHEGLETMGIPFRFDTGQLQRLILNLLDKKNLLANDVIVRLQVWRDGRRGYHPDENSETHFSLTASACPDNFQNPRLATVERRRIPAESLPSNIKFCNGINYIMAASEAAQKGGDDALMQTVDGSISETTIANIFWIRDGNIFTPSEECDLIPGITRALVLQLIDRNSWKLEIGSFQMPHIFEAETAWVCNSVREILPVKKVDSHSLNTEHKLLVELKNQFAKFRDQNLKPLEPND